MAHIAIDARIIYTSTGRYVERLVHHLQDLDTKNTYTVLLNQQDYERWEPRADNFRKALADHKQYTFDEQLGLWQQLNRLKPDLVHFTVPQQPLLYRGRRITTIHDLTLINYVNKRREGALKNFYKQQVKPRVFARLLRNVVKRSEELIAPTDYVREQLITQLHANSEHTTTTYEAAERLAARAKAIPELAGERFIVYVGNAFPYKNIQRLIDAASRLKDTKLVLVGKPDFFYGQLQLHTTRKGYANIHFAGFVSDAELAWIYQHAQLYVFPSLSEGFGLPGLEAMSYGLPVASSSATCLPEVYGEAAEYFDPTDTAAIHATIARLLNDPKRLAELKAAGESQIKKYSWRRMAEQTLALYQRSLH